MAINATLKAMCSLLKHRNPELQQSAIRVLGALHPREAAVYKCLGELLLNTEDTVTFGCLLDAIEANPHEQCLKYLVKVLDREPDMQQRIMNCVAKIGGKSVAILKSQFSKVSDRSRCLIASVLPSIRTNQAHAFFVECLFDADHELIREAVHALREEINNYSQREKSDLLNKLFSALTDKRTKQDVASLSAIIICIGIVGDIRAKQKLLPFVANNYPVQIRRHALMSLARFEYAGDKHHAMFETLLSIFKENDYEGIVRHAVHVLDRIKPRRSDNAKLRKFLESRHEGVKAYVISALGQLDSITNAELIIGFLHSQTLQLREASAQALRNMPSAVEVILRHIDEVKNRAEAFEMVRILESHGNKIKPDRAKKMIRHMLELYEQDDEHYQLYRMALRHLRGDVLQKDLVSIAKRAWTKKDYEHVRDTLKILDHTDLMTPEIRFTLAIAKLKTSAKDFSRSFRLSDYCLEHISILLRDNPKEFSKKFLAEKALEPEDYVYVGFHFSECVNEERRFGVDLLRRAVKRWPRKSAIAAARKKLKVEGH